MYYPTYYLLYFISIIILVSTKNLKDKNPNKLSFIADIFNNDKFVGGGVVYKRDIVITAATYVQVLESSLSVGINVGENLYQSSEEREVGDRYKVTGVTIHPNFTRSIHSTHNIALVALMRRAPLPHRIQLDNLGTDIVTGLELDLIGWGFTDDSWDQYEHLHHLKQTTISALECQSLLPRRLLTDAEFCVGQPNNHNEVIGLISDGSPLLYFHNDTKPILVGILAWTTTLGYGQSYGYGYAPAVFIKIAHYHQWITDMVIGN